MTARLNGGASAVILALAIAAGTSCAQTPPPGSSERPVTAERLRGARLEYHRSDPKLVWSFGKEAFVLSLGGEALPRDLIETLTGQRTDALRIEGTWSLDQNKNVLRLAVQQADGKPICHQAELPIFPAGLIRVDLGDHQYNVFPGQADLGDPGHPLTFQQDGQDLIVTTTVELVDAPHVLWTRAGKVMDVDPHLEGPRHAARLSRVELSYYVIQCRDDPYMKHMRHRKKTIDVVWRIPDHQQAEVPYRVIEQFSPSAAELKQLAPRLETIAKETERRAPLAVP